MRKIIAGAFVSLDGIMQAPGGPDEDPTGGFRFGGWVAALFDETVGQAVDEMMSKPFDLLLGRKTYDIFAAHWPYVETDPTTGDFDALNQGIAEKFNRLTKYVATHRPESLTWQNSQALGPDPVAALKALKQEDGPDLLTQGSTELLKTLLAHGLVDEFNVSIFPVILGKGKRLFSETARPHGLKLVSSRSSPSGTIVTKYVPDGEVRLGSFEFDTPTEAEMERRKNLN